MPTIAARVEEEIAEHIISGRYPPGMRLDERQLAANLNVSRTPIREALRQLARRGLTQILPMRGVIVRKISLQEVMELLQANSELEALCARIAATTMTDLEKTELEYVFEKSKEHVSSNGLAPYLEANQEFHRMIIEGCHNEVLIQFVADVRERLSPYRRYHPHEQNRLEKSTDAHAKIVKAILEGQAEKAYVAMKAHNVQLSASALRALKRQQPSESQLDTDLENA